MKKNFREIQNALDKILRLRGVSFEWIKEDLSINSSEKLDVRDIGVIAQEIQEEFPELIIEDNNGILSVRYALLVSILTEAIQQQNSILDKKEIELERLETLAREKGLM